ncbi:NUDIX hydrolase [Ethanoligenens harbinense]|uniref:NUDIX hydrolase n=1 Tax=Ethanoligenens harbinense (strain DSM 18485 / JCM 12961 / CGMCC 1.5033 / YUAN-3) TaxID=663278 RepID=E6U6M1_ETHHY|nr:NUDIX domain-containing protein [Ethanoligenens harbinense]ADU25754.1 NUDIX hydrolase [Ethanoligenens harbinense YUAN-3]AVQ94925.1 NUDIX domain-containing protein [Ethanoligenens harbinense YUAN-3]AYF37617.1 NUDIX domain-containing protein [Ethanoligenens harbinense]AYF40337.1 NUDIX domain-containing protein [Ethanoligenens harbinense]QCN91173.1 NUDIX domain-containing protein [Ethanoligenens harbinense]
MEWMDLRDGTGRPTGRLVPREHALQNGEFMLAVHVFIYRDDGRFLLQKRSLRKRLYPGKWDITGGGVRAGESSLEAACREVEEEVGLTLPPRRMQKLARLKRPPCFFDVWACRHAFEMDELVLQAEEVDAVRLVTPQEMLTVLFEEEYPDGGYRRVLADFLANAADAPLFRNG